MKRLITAAAVLVLATSVAGAASMKHKSSASAGKCWDAASSTVKDKSTQTASGQKKAGAVTTGSGSSGNATNSTGSQLQTRPRGMKDC